MDIRPPVQPENLPLPDVENPFNPGDVVAICPTKASNARDTPTRMLVTDTHYKTCYCLIQSESGHSSGVRVHSSILIKIKD